MSRFTLFLRVNFKLLGLCVKDLTHIIVFSSVFCNCKDRFVFLPFLFEGSFLCKFTYLHLLSGLQGRIREKYMTANKNTSD